MVNKSKEVVSRPDTNCGFAVQYKPEKIRLLAASYQPARPSQATAAGPKELFQLTSAWVFLSIHKDDPCSGVDAEAQVTTQ